MRSKLSYAKSRPIIVEGIQVSTGQALQKLAYFLFYTELNNTYGRATTDGERQIVFDKMYDSAKAEYQKSKPLPEY